MISGTAVQLEMDILGANGGGIVTLGEEIYDLDVTGGWNIPENVQVRGVHYDRKDTPDTGTILHYTGSGAAITVNGTWTPFNGRRHIGISDLTIICDDPAAVGIKADFMTHFHLTRVHVTGAAVGFDFTNCYRGVMTQCGVKDCAYGLNWTTDDSDPVMCGQTVLTQCSWRSCEEVGVTLWNETDKDMLQLNFIGNHFNQCDTGLLMRGDNFHAIKFDNCQFEACETAVEIEGTVTQSPTFDTCNFWTCTTGIVGNGGKLQVTGCDFRGRLNFTDVGIAFAGTGLEYSGNFFHNYLSYAVTLSSAARRVYIGNNYYAGTVTTPLQDSSGQRVYHQWEDDGT